MFNNRKVIFILGVLALLAIFVLIIFARMALRESLDKTLDQYEQGPVTTLGPQGQPAADPLLTKGVLIPPVLPTDPVRGDTRAQLTIIEFGDFQCPFCADIAPVLAQVLASYPEVRLVWKDLPNPAHPQARPAALAARCAQNQDKFWEFHDLLFANQAELGDKLYKQIAEVLELDLTSFNSCLASQAYIEVVGEGLAAANNL